MAYPTSCLQVLGPVSCWLLPFENPVARRYDDGVHFEV